MLTRRQADDIADRVLDWGREHDTGRLTAAVLDSGAVSYTHLTLPTTPYV